MSLDVSDFRARPLSTHHPMGVGTRPLVTLGYRTWMLSAVVFSMVQGLPLSILAIAYVLHCACSLG